MATIASTTATSQGETCDLAPGLQAARTAACTAPRRVWNARAKPMK